MASPPTSGGLQHTAPLQGRGTGPLITIVWLFVGIILCLMVLAYFSFAILSAGRAYVGGEGLWSKGQKDAVYHLVRYAQTREERDYTAYMLAIAVPLGDRIARLELEKPDPDLRIAEEGFLMGRNHAEDIDGMIQLFRRFRHFHHMDKAIDIWTRADVYIVQLIDAGENLHAEILSARPNEQRIHELLAEVDDINARLTPLEDDFSYTLGEAARHAQRLLLMVLFIVAIVFLSLGVFLSRRIVAGAEAVQRAAQASEAQLRKVIHQAPVPFFISRLHDGKVLLANERACEQLKWPSHALLGQPAPDFYAVPEIYSEFFNAIQRDGEVRDREVQLKDSNDEPFWTLLSSQRLTYQGEPCVLTAFSDIEERKRLHAEMHHRAYHDELTNVSNRAMFHESLAQALARARRRATTFSILFVDLDHFKEINDTLGHEAGDVLLRDLARRLVANVRRSDLVARYGGDEFVVLIEEHRDNDMAAMVARKVLQALSQPFVLNGREVKVTASLGISSYPQDGADLDVLMRNADAAMYKAKENGRNNFQFHVAAPAVGG